MKSVRPKCHLFAAFALVAACRSAAPLPSATESPARPGAPAIAGTLGAGFEVGAVVELGRGNYFILGVTDANPRKLGVVLTQGKQQLDAQAREDVFGGPEWTCKTSADVSAEVREGHVILHVVCVNGDQAVDKRRTSIVLVSPVESPTRVSDFRVRWAGPTSWSVDRPSSGCAQGSDGTLEFRAEELWLVRKPWMKATDGADCVSPPEAEPEVRLDPA